MISILDPGWINVLTVAEDTNGVVKSHRLDVERSQNGLLVCQGGVIVGRHLNSWFLNFPQNSKKCWCKGLHLGGEYHTHITQIYVDRPQISSTEGWTLAKLNRISWYFFNYQDYLRWEQISWEDFEASSILFSDTPPPPQWQHAWAHGSGSWKLWGA